MKYDVKRNEDSMVLKLEGRLDTTSSPEIDSFVRSSLDGVKELCFDMNDLDYISSAGLRVLMTAQKIMNRQGKMIVTGCSEEILEIFDITGFSDIMTIR